MKKKYLTISILALSLLVLGCSSDKKAQTGFMSNLGDCNVVFQKCMAESTGTQKERSNKCEQARGMCGAIRTKGCMQKCIERYGKNTTSAETCKNDCSKRRW